MPLMCPASELADRLEPHDMIYSWSWHRAAALTSWEVGRGVPGVAEAGGYWEGTIPGTKPEARLRLDLTNY